MITVFRRQFNHTYIPNRGLQVITITRPRELRTGPTMFRHTLRRLKPPPQLADGYPTSIHALRPPHKPGQPSATTLLPTVITHGNLQEFTPSDKASKFAAETRIAFPTALRLVPGQKFNDFPLRISACNRHVFSYYHIKYLVQYEHPLTDKTLHYYAQQRREKSLWCYVHGSSASDGSNAVVRNTSERVVRAALFRALNAAGYDSSGRSLDGTKRDLRGTIRVAVSQPKAVLKIEFERLLGYLTKLVSDLSPRLTAK